MGKRSRQKKNRRLGVEPRPQRPLRAAPERALASPAHGQAAQPAEAPDPLALVRRRHRSVLAAQAREAEAVALARAAGVSWAALGEIVGVTGEGARRRWSAG